VKQGRLSLEKSHSGHHAWSLPESDVPAAPTVNSQLQRRRPLRLPELSELEVIRHFTNLSQLNYSIDTGMYPLGSCTMKYNPRVNEATASSADFLHLHPSSPVSDVQGALELMYRLENALAEISGFARVSLQPAAGAQGEYTGLRMIRAWLDHKKDSRRKILIPDSAHGTNPATASICGFQVIQLKSTSEGLLDISEIDRLTSQGDVAGLMVTNPNTCGLFEKNIIEAVRLIQERGGLVYCDGANMNAMLGVTRPGDAGFDVMHFNLHKTFTTPHGGGGPGCGAVGVSKTLEPFLPRPTIEKDPNVPERFIFDDERPLSIGKVKDYYGHFLMQVRAYTYIRELGAQGIRKAGEDAILLANYIRMRLRGYYEIPFDRPCMHEVVLSDKKQQANGIKTLDIAKRLIDLGFHPPTIYFPLLIPGALMIEPTETESLDTVKRFCDVMIQIAEEAKTENAFKTYFEGAPRNAKVGRVDETKAAKDLILSWKDLAL
jgi:glycine dehydrogenase subunit 2